MALATTQFLELLIYYMAVINLPTNTLLLPWESTLDMKMVPFCAAYAKEKLHF